MAARLILREGMRRRMPAILGWLFATISLAASAVGAVGVPQSVGAADADDALPAIYRSVPASTNVPEAQSPRVYADGRVTFRLKFPSATTVQVAGGAGLGRTPFPMSQDSDGAWSVTIPPVTVGFHYYWFTVDGTPVNDPGSETFFGYGKPTSGIEVPDPFFVSTLLISSPRPAFYDPQDGAHGRIDANWYFSRATGRWRRCFVYTPPGYGDPANAQTRYPLLVLQHGAGEDETGWGKQGRVNFIMDKLIDAGKAQPMLVVMDNDYGTFAPAVGAVPAQQPQDPYLRLPPGLDAFGTIVLDEVIPLVDAGYRTIADRDHRAIAGLSLGGVEAMAVGLGHLDVFGSVGSFSGAQFVIAAHPPPAGGSPPLGLRLPPFDPTTSYGGVFADAPGFNAKVHVLWFGAGTAEVDFNATLRAAARQLRAHGIRLTVYESPGTAHEWLTWRRDLAEFAPLLFR
jgi:enterochelin esterase family protein